MSDAVKLMQRMGNMAGRVGRLESNDSPIIEKPLQGAADTGCDHSFHFAQTSDTGGTLTAGRFYLGGVLKTISGLPGSITVTTTTLYWLVVLIDESTVEWTSGIGGSYPDSSAAMEIWPMLEITCAGGIITGIIERQTSDIHMTLTP